LVTGRLDCDLTLDDGNGIIDEDCLLDSEEPISLRTVVAATAAELVRIDRAKFVGAMTAHDDFREHFNFDNDDDVDVPVLGGRPSRPQMEMEILGTTAACLA